MVALKKQKPNSKSRPLFVMATVKPRSLQVHAGWRSGCTLTLGGYGHGICRQEPGLQKSGQRPSSGQAGLPPGPHPSVAGRTVPCLQDSAQRRRPTVVTGEVGRGPQK